jgi:molybdenum cofactor synthesis domain-containing protein
MRPIKSLISVKDALKICLDSIDHINEYEEVNLLNSAGRVLSLDITSPIDVPGFNRAAMDGYAVKAEDTFGATKFNPSALKLIEKIYAGDIPKKSLNKGECSEIATGAMIPGGADAIVIVENTEIKGKDVFIFKPVYPWENVSKKGSDIPKGTNIIKKGEVLAPPKIGAIAALGIDRIKVFKKPVIGIFSTGNEISEPGSPLEPGKIYNINSYTLGAIVIENGGIPEILPTLSDNRNDIRRVLNENRWNVIVFSGGSSVGEMDILMDVIEEMGEVLFHGIAIKPGKPTLLGRVNKKIVLGMPGHPTSCLSNGYIILAPMIRKIARLPEKEERALRLPLGKREVSTIGRHQFLTVKVEKGVAYPVFKESSDISSMSDADGYIEIPENVDLMEKGDIVEVKLF